MLQRAASNAYSWWWASHIRTKQSKWLETNLQGMCIHNIDMLLKLNTFFSFLFWWGGGGGGVMFFHHFFTHQQDAIM